MNKKWKKLSLWSFGLALLQFVLSFLFFHYVTPDGAFTLVFREEPGKPMVSFLFGAFGVLFLFAGSMSRLIARIFFPAEKEAAYGQI
ncbi:MAG: hypothetical protein IJO37_03730 [Ruminiclostridium sp.]|nr:hypothetical protein [Ruminiclostridium sp.]